jgi:3-oxoacyl-[acyl-carrier-protein] synthase II
VIEMSMTVEGIGSVGAFGAGIKALVTAAGDGTRPGLPTVEATPAEAADGKETRQLSVYRASTEGLEEFFEKRELRRIDHYSKMALLAASLALKDAERFGERQGTTGIIVATGYGPHRTTFAFLDSFLKEGNAFASPTQFASSVHNAAAAYAGILLKERGPSLTVSQFEMSVSSALLTAWCWLAEERVDRVLLGAIDEYSDVLGYCWETYFGVPGPGQTEISPLDFDRQSAIPGEGSVFLVLSRDKSRMRHGCITGVDMGFLDRTTLDLSGRNTLFIGADGHRETGASYRTLVAGRKNLVCHTPAYGSLPTGQAFDVAIAAHQIGAGTNDRLAVRTAAQCLKLGRNGEFGLVALGSE